MLKAISLIAVSGALVLGQTTSAPTSPPEATSTQSPDPAKRIRELSWDLKGANERLEKLQGEVEVLKRSRRESDGLQLLEELLQTSTEWRGVIKTRYDDSDSVMLKLDVQGQPDRTNLSIQLRAGEYLGELTAGKTIRVSCRIQDINCNGQGRFRSLQAIDGRILEVVKQP